MEEEGIKFSKDEYGRTLVKKIFGDKKANFVGLWNTMTAIWPTKEMFKIRELGKNLFQFVFSNQEDLHRVAVGKVWTFDQQYLILKEWREGMNLATESFNFVQTWIQIWNVPPHWMSKEVGLKVRKLFSSVSEVVIPEFGSSRGRYIKILAIVNLNKPLSRGTNIKLNNVACWVNFKCEQLATFCYYCGRIGHSDRLCVKREEDLRKKELKEGQYGDLLKGVSGRISSKESEGRMPVKITGRRGEIDKKDRREAENESLKELYVPVV